MKHLHHHETFVKIHSVEFVLPHFPVMRHFDQGITLLPASSDHPPNQHPSSNTVSLWMRFLTGYANQHCNV